MLSWPCGLLRLTTVRRETVRQLPGESTVLSHRLPPTTQRMARRRSAIERTKMGCTCHAKWEKGQDRGISNLVTG